MSFKASIRQLNVPSQGSGVYCPAMPVHRSPMDKLIDEAVRLGGHKSKSAAVTAALDAYVRQMKRATFRGLIGTVDFHDDVDHRALRRRRTGRGR